MTIGPRAVGDTSSNVGSQPAAIAALNADIGILTAVKDTLEIIPVKVLFEFVIIILGLVRVRVIVLLPFFYSFLVIRSGRGDRRRRVCGIGKVLRPSVPRVEGCDRREGHG